MFKRNEIINAINFNLFIKISDIDNLSKAMLDDFIKKTFITFNGLTHYEIIKYKKRKYIIFYYMKKPESINFKFKIKLEQFKLPSIERILSNLNKNIFFYLDNINDKLRLRFFIKGKLIYISSCKDENLYECYNEALTYIEEIFGKDITIIKTKNTNFILNGKFNSIKTHQGEKI